MKKKYLIVLLGLIFHLSAMAQQKGEGYSGAVRLIDLGNQEEAMDQLRPYLNYKEYGNLSLYARYHFARSAYKNNQYQLAQATLLDLLGNYNWEREDDGLYLLTLVYFAQNEAYDGLSQISKIDGEMLKKEGYKASYDYLSKNATTSFLAAHWGAFKQNKGYTLALKEKLLSQSVLTSGEKKILAEMENMDLGEGNTGTARIKNETLDVAVVLPFNYQGGAGVSDLEGNNFIFELYQGISMAIERARSQGMDIEVKTFDTERKNEVVNKILADPFFSKADIIVGPLYPEETEIVAGFAQNNRIPFVNPLSNITDGFDGMEYAYLFRPSTKVIVDRILNYSRSHVKGNRIALAYSGSTRDELMAREFAEEASKRGYRLVFNQKVNSSSIRGFMENIGVRPGSTASVDQIVIFSDDPYIASPTLSLLESQTTETPIFVMDSWLYFNFANFDMLDGNELYFVGNNTIDLSKKAVEDYRYRFFERYHVYPGTNAYVGYDLMNWLAKTINNQRGFDFRRNLDQNNNVEGSLSFGLNFNNSHSNQYVPVLKLNAGKLEEIKL
ncbi:ABC transporter substrate-binding protein [Echinicola marina]|uniref:ABC transporter substrate-binding protein n=1 Tax=Echinicola marina TaxID=2859768 RepID=UPI001CF6FFF6|nr:ABC transporter substrate-binding protein [Echinicola marina]UCS93593.1 ABC transporter substrate-binding protein [Echinicola marina]